MTVSPFTQMEIDREFRTAAAHGAADRYEIRIARVLFEVNAIEPRPANVAHALGAAARILDCGKVMPSQIRRLYGNGGLTYDLVTNAVQASA
ncbi:hypothetical protein SEA_DONNY_21 [Mycobacterium phage Donny]|uniref:Uncharacterized protein n=3 Tax=Acadianvirus acadian TaxID=1982901 RepID=A0A7M1CP56_9CAUD|nr:hypothetical protein CM14_gp21 [Mycobacterium phage Acadian]AER48935.1 hypothetical protein ACADIAN_21 [Mycobacterium phage Acadian]QBI96476.1 hypothetical protein SEA_DONNY_21 [Mycobacterium phage Donny]QOP65563.1 hypothetical protein SEA_SUIGENERIS_21 [Mycobacterium phage Suigeneris]WUT94791.1 hypothetical protein PRODRIGUEZ_21 [Mycobacterium phage PRodriguez]